MRLKRITLHAAGVLVLLAFCGHSGWAQVISTVVGAYNVSGKTATTVSIWTPAGTVSDSAGNVYFSSHHRVYKLNSTGVLTLVAGSGNYGNAGDGGLATSAKMYDPGGMALDSAGNLYIPDRMYGVVRKVDAATGIISTVAGTGKRGYTGDGGPATSARLNWCMDVAIDRYGNLYIADALSSVIRKVDASTGNISTVAGTGVTGYSGDGGLATSATFNAPESVLVDSSGNLFIADSMNNAIRMVAASTGLITTIVGTGTKGYAGDGGLAKNANIAFPFGLATDRSGNLFFVDSDNQVIRKVDTATGILSTVAGNGQVGYTGDGGAAAKATLNNPVDLTFDSSGNLFISDSANFVLRKVDAATGTISTAAGNGYYSYSGDGGLATAAQLQYPMGTAMDSATNLYVVDNGNFAIRKVDAKTGLISTAVGTGAYGYSGDGGPATSANFGAPIAMAVDRSDNLYIADSEFSVIRKVEAATGIITTVAGNGSFGYSGDGGLATSAQLSFPASVAVDASGNLLIADTGNYAVRKVDASTGTISTVAGGHSWGYTGDGGPATSAQFFSLDGVALDPLGNLYISDGGAGVVREVSLNPADTAHYGLITTIAGGGSVTVTSTPSKALEANILYPFGLYVDYAGTVFFADPDSNSIFKITGSSFASPSSGTIVTVAGIGKGTYAYTGDGGLATSAELGGPYGVSGDYFGNLLIADSTNSLVRKVAGIVSTAPESVLSATSLGFGTLVQNSGATATKTLTIANPGTRALTVSSVTISGVNASDFTQTNTCLSAAVAPASTCSISVVFAAKSTGIESARLTIVSSALNSPQTVSLSGAGIIFSAPLAITSGSTTATVPSGTTAAYLLQLTASGGSTVSDALTVSLNCTGAPAGATCILPASVTATPSAPGAFTVSVTTTKASTTSASLRQDSTSGLALALIPFGMIGLGLARKRRKWMGLFLLVLLAVATTSVGCGSKSTTSTGTTAGTYTLVVKATSGTLSQSTNLTLIVQ